MSFNMPGYGTPPDLATHYNTTPWIIRQRVKDGTLPAFQLGPRTMRISWAAAEEVFGPNASQPVTS